MDLTSEDIERLRRSLAMLTPGQPATVLKREQAIELLEELQRLQGLLGQAVKRLRITLAGLEGLTVKRRAASSGLPTTRPV